MYAPVSDRRNEIWARRATVEQHRRRSAMFGSRQPSCRTEQPEEYIGYDSLRSPLVPIDRRHFAKPFSVSQKLMVEASDLCGVIAIHNDRATEVSDPDRGGIGHGRYK